MMFPIDVQQTYETIQSRWRKVVFTGSRAIGCPRDDSDWDFVVEDAWPTDLSEFAESFDEGDDASLNRRQAEDGGPKFTSVRIGLVNLIVDHRPDSLGNWAAATDYCTEMRVFDKEERIKVFDMFGAG